MAALFTGAVELAMAIGAIGVELAVTRGIELAVVGRVVGLGVVEIEFGVVDNEGTESFSSLPPFDFFIKEGGLGGLLHYYKLGICLDMVNLMEKLCVV